jgi:hypothetical protein
MEVTAGKMENLPRAPSARPDLPVALGDATHDAGEQSECRVGDRLGEHIRRVTHRDASLMAGGHIDVVHSHRHLRDHFESAAPFEELGIYSIGQHAEKTPDVVDLLQ